MSVSASSLVSLLTRMRDYVRSRKEAEDGGYIVHGPMEGVRSYG